MQAFAAGFDARGAHVNTRGETLACAFPGLEEYVRALSVTMSRGYAPSVHRDSKGRKGTSESIVFCGGTDGVFMTEVGLIKIPPSGILIMLSAQDTAHVACLCASDAKLKATPANIKHALEKGKVSSAH